MDRPFPLWLDFAICDRPTPLLTAAVTANKKGMIAYDTALVIKENCHSLVSPVGSCNYK